MKRDTVHIADLRLRTPGLTNAEGRALGNAVAKHLGELAASLKRSKTIDRLTLQVKSRSSTSVDRIAVEIANAIKSRVI